MHSAYSPEQDKEVSVIFWLGKINVSCAHPSIVLYSRTICSDAERDHIADDVGEGRINKSPTKSLVSLAMDSIKATVSRITVIERTIGFS